MAAGISFCPIGRGRGKAEEPADGFGSGHAFAPAPGVEILEVAFLESDADEPSFAGCLRPTAERFALTFSWGLG